MRLYYQGIDVLVTDEAFEVMTPYPQRFRIKELAQVRVVRRSFDRTVVASIHTTTGALVIVAFSLPVLHSVESWLIATLLVGAASLVSGACMRIRPRVRELRAVYHDQEVCLYVSGDPRVFGQVQRALIRARERC